MPKYSRKIMLWPLLLVLSFSYCTPSDSNAIGQKADTTISTYINIRQPLRFDNFVLPDSFNYTHSNQVYIYPHEKGFDISVIDTGAAYVYFWYKRDTFFKARIHIKSTPEFDSLTAAITRYDTAYIRSDATREIMYEYSLLNKKVPPFMVQKISGGTLSDTDLSGRISFINLWYYGCGAGMEELQDLTYIHRKYRSRVSFYSFFSDSAYVRNGKSYFYYRKPVESAGNIAFGDTFVTYKIKYPVAYNCKALETAFRFRGYPHSYLVDAHGIIRAIYPGYSTDGKYRETLINGIAFLMHRSD